MGVGWLPWILGFGWLFWVLVESGVVGLCIGGFGVLVGLVCLLFADFGLFCFDMGVFWGLVCWFGVSLGFLFVCEWFVWF